MKTHIVKLFALLILLALVMLPMAAFASAPDAFTIVFYDNGELTLLGEPGATLYQVGLVVDGEERHFYSIASISGNMHSQSGVIGTPGVELRLNELITLQGRAKLVCSFGEEETNVPDPKDVEQILIYVKPNSDPIRYYFTPYTATDSYQAETLEPVVLTISRVELVGMLSIGDVFFTDEDGIMYSMPSDWDSWFANATVADVIIEKGTAVPLGGGLLGKGSALTFTFVVDGVKYPIKIGESKQLVAAKAKNGQYILLPNETLAMAYAHSDNAEAAWTEDACTVPEVDDSGLWLYAVKYGIAAIRGYNGDLQGDLILPNELDGYPVAHIWSEAFFECAGLTNVTISEGVTSIGDSAFAGCDSLTSVAIPDGVTSISDWAFGTCVSLTQVTIPESVTSIGYRAFAGCAGLTGVVIPEAVTSIGDYAFTLCSGLTWVSIPKSVAIIEPNAFSECPEITLIVVKSSKAAQYAARNGVPYITVNSGTLCSRDGLYLYTLAKDQAIISQYRGTSANLVIPDQLDGYAVVAIGISAFERCQGLISVSLPDSITEIGSTAFNGCSGLTSVHIPDSVTEIGKSAFYGCSGLTSVYIPDSVIKIGESAFSGCSGLTSMRVPDGVTVIGNSMFYGCSGLTSVYIPDSVTQINNSAFSGCSGLTSVHIPDSVTQIGTSAFSGCSGLTSVYIPDSVTQINNSAFSGCSGLTGVRIPEGVTAINNSTFSSCSGLTSVRVPDGVTRILPSAFSFCDGLTSVSIPASVDSIADDAFGDVRLTLLVSEDSYAAQYAKKNKIPSLFDGGDFAYTLSKKNATIEMYLGDANEIIIPEELEGRKVTSIGKSVFENRTDLVSITIPKGVKSIGKNAFAGCSEEFTLIVHKGSAAAKYAQKNKIPFVLWEDIGNE